MTVIESPILRKYMPELDTIRGIAILLVLFFHGMAPPISGRLSHAGMTIFAASQYGWVGVNLFFVLSGFLITGILIDNRLEADFYRRFYLRRALRILPALYAVLIVLTMGRWIGLRFLALSALFMANCGQLFGVALQYGPFWSLAVEEHFYLLWPTLVRKFSTRHLVLTLTAIVFLTPALRLVNSSLLPPHDDMSSLYTWLNLDGLAMGGMLAIWVRQPSFSRTHLRCIALPALVLGVIAFAMVKTKPSLEATLLQTTADVAAFGFIICFLLLGTSRWRVLVDQKMLKLFGFISYGLYLVHVLVFRVTDDILATRIAALHNIGGPDLAMLLRFFMGSALATSIAYLSRRSFEQVFLRVGFAHTRTKRDEEER